jgi:hypothetical protein
LRGFSTGAKALNGGSVTLSAVVVERSANSAVHAQGKRSKLVATGCALRDSAPLAGAPEGAAGAVVLDQATLALTGCDVAGHEMLGVYAASGNATATLSGTLVRDTTAARTKTGAALFAESAGVFVLQGSALVRNAGGGVYVGSSRLTATDSAIVGSMTGPGQYSGEAIVALGASTATLTRVSLVGNQNTGVHLLSGAALTATDVELRDTRPDPGGRSGLGIEADDGSTIEVHRVALVGNSTAAVYLEAGATLTGDRLLVAGQLQAPNNTEVLGVVLQHGSTVTLDASAIVGTPGDALSALGDPLSDDGTFARLRSTAVLHTRVRASGDLGRGVWVQDAHLEFTDGLVGGATEVGVMVYGPRATGALTRVTVRDVLASPRGGFGDGVTLYEGTLALVDTFVRGSQEVGLAVAAGAGSVSGGGLIRNGIALHVQQGTELSEVDTVPAVPTPFELDVSTATSFVLNTTRLGTGMVPLPVAASAYAR